MEVSEARKRGPQPKERGATTKRQRGEEDKKSAKHEDESKQHLQAPPGRNTTRRPFFGVIDNVSSFSGMIEGPYDFGFAISITVDRQTFKGVVFKGNDQQQSDNNSVFPDEEIMMSFASVANATASASKGHAKAQSKPNTPIHSTPSTPKQPSSISSSAEELRLPAINSFDQRQPSPHSSPSTPHNDSLPSSSEFKEEDDHSAYSSSSSHPSTPSSYHSGSSSYSQYHQDEHHHHHDDQLPAIHSVLQGMHHSSSFNGGQSNAPISPSQPQVPLPPQPQLQRQKQRQKKRQEKKLLELQQQQPQRYQSMIEQREKSKIPLLGAADESLVKAGFSILQQMERP